MLVRLRPSHLVNPLQLLPYLFFQVVIALLVAPRLLDDLRFALDHQSVSALVFPPFVQQARVAHLQNLAQLGQTALADRAIASGGSFFSRPTGTASHSIVGVVLGLVAVVGLGQLVSEVVKVLGDPDGTHEFLLGFLALRNIERETLNLFLDEGGLEDLFGGGPRLGFQLKHELDDVRQFIGVSIIDGFVDASSNCLEEAFHILGLKGRHERGHFVDDAA